MFKKRTLKKLIKANDITVVTVLAQENPKLFDLSILVALFEEGTPEMRMAVANVLPIDKTFDKDKWTFLHVAGEFNCAGSARVCMERNPQALQTATRYGHLPLHTAALCGKLDTLDVMLEYGADIHALARHGRTALHEAAENGHALVVARLIALGADVNALDHKGDSPFALAKKGDKSDVVFILTRHQAKGSELPFLPAPHQATELAPLWCKVDEYTIIHAREDKVTGYGLADIFNFGTGRCISVQRNLASGAETAVSVDMSELVGRPLYEQARQELAAQGGAAPVIAAPVIKKLPSNRDV